MNLIKLLGSLLLVGLIIYFSYKTVSYSQRTLNSLIQNKRVLLIARIVAILIGLIIGFLLSSITFRISDAHVIVGLPVPWAIWENVNGRWEDFASPLSVVPWATDFIFAVMLAHLPIAVVSLVRKRHVAPGAI